MINEPKFKSGDVVYFVKSNADNIIKREAITEVVLKPVNDEYKIFYRFFDRWGIFYVPEDLVSINPEDLAEAKLLNQLYTLHERIDEANKVISDCKKEIQEITKKLKKN